MMQLIDTQPHSSSHWKKLKLDKKWTTSIPLHENSTLIKGLRAYNIFKHNAVHCIIFHCSLCRTATSLHLTRNNKKQSCCCDCRW